MNCDKSGNRGERNYGIDLLRIVSMLFVPVLHVLGHGGVLDTVQPFSIHSELAWFLEIMVYCAVNCFALISGFVGYGAEYKYANLIYLYLQVVFYTVTVSCIFAIGKPGSVGIKDFIKAILPFDTYWYFTAYFCMFFFIPFMNFLMDRLQKDMAKKMICSIVILFSVVPTLFLRDLFLTGSGYSALWLSMLYLIGAYIRKYDVTGLINKRQCLWGYFICVFITWGSRFILLLVSSTENPECSLLLINYTSPTILGAAILLLLFFEKLHPGNKWKRIIAYFAPTAFGVYLIHEEPLIREQFIMGRFVPYSKMNPIAMLFAVLGTAFLIWLVCSLTDKVRLEIFRIFKIKEFSDKIEKMLKRKNFSGKR